MGKVTPGRSGNPIAGLARKTLGPIRAFTRRQTRDLVVALVLAVAFALICDRGFKYWEQWNEARTLQHVWSAAATVVTYDPDGRAANTGCGIFIQPGGVLITSDQSVGTPRVEARLASGAFYRLKDVVREDPAAGVTVLQFEGTDLPYAPLGDSDRIEVGQKVLALTAQPGTDCGISPGVINQAQTTVGASPINFIQFTGSGTGTGSGGLFNTRGEVVGIIAGSLLPAGLPRGASTGFAVPINRIKAAIQGQAAAGAGMSEGSPEYFYSLGVLAESRRQYDKAIGYLQKAISLDTKFAEAYLELGNVYYAQGAYDKELQAYRQAFAYAPHSLQVSYSLATAYEDLQMYDQAIAQHLKTLEIKPDFKDSLYQLCILYIGRGEPAKAREFAAKLAAVDPGLAKEMELILGRTK